jgi:glycosyltransferase involved in cell wall biosynthesis
MAAKISIVTPSLNQGRFIEDTLKSVVNQRFDGLQYLVLDGGSQDETLSVLERYDDRIDVLVSEPDRGHAHALQKGFALAEGEILAYLNSDDLYLPGVLDVVWRFFVDNPTIDLIYSDRIFIDSDNRVTGAWYLPPHWNHFMTHWPYIPQETAFWRRSAHDAVGGIETEFFFAFDWEFFIRLMRGGRARKLNRVNAAFRLHPASKSMRLGDSVGRGDVAKVRAKHGIKISAPEWCIGKLVEQYIRRRSSRRFGPERQREYTDGLRALGIETR